MNFLVSFRETGFVVRKLHGTTRVDGASLYDAVNGSGWLAAAVRFDGASRTWQLLTGQYPQRANCWTTIARSNGKALGADDSLTTDQRARYALATTALDFLRGTGPALDSDRYALDRPTVCAACDKPLWSNATMRTIPADAPNVGANGLRLNGMTVAIGPECYQRVTQERATRNAARKAEQEAERNKRLAALGLSSMKGWNKADRPKAKPPCGGPLVCTDWDCDDCG